MGNYSLVEHHVVIPYDTIEEQYVVTVNLSCLSLFLFLSIKNTTKKSVNIYFCLYNLVQIMANTKCEFNKPLGSDELFCVWILYNTNKYLVILLSSTTITIYFFCDRVVFINTFLFLFSLSIKSLFLGKTINKTKIQIVLMWRVEIFKYR